MNKKINFLVSLAYWGAIVLLVLCFLRFVLPAILPFVIGYLVATLWNPAITALSKARKRSFAAVLIIVPFWGVVLFLLWKTGVMLYGEAVDLLKWIRNTDFSDVLSGIELPFIRGNVAEWIANKTDDLIPALLELSQGALMKLMNLLLGVPDALVFVFATVVSSFLFSLVYPKIEPFVLRQLSARMQTEYFDLKEFLSQKMFRIIRAYGVMFAINYGELLVGFFILKVPYPLILAAIIALFDLLPYVGILSVLLPWGVAEWFLFSRPALGIGLIVLAVIVSVLREILEPKIIGKTIGLSPLATLISIYLGLKWVGFWGMLLFPLLFLLFKEWNDSGRIQLWKTLHEE